MNLFAGILSIVAGFLGIFSLFFFIVWFIALIGSITRKNNITSSAIEAGDLEAQQTPRSLNGADRLLLPRIKADFPDFQPELAKTYVRKALEKQHQGKDGFTIYNIVIAAYVADSVEKCVVYQAAYSYLENGRRQQKRCDLHYTRVLSGRGAVAANCPNCGGVLELGETVCSYCGSRVTIPMDRAWAVTDIRES